ncbi:PAS domain S-box protein [Leptospira inadai serovar Lyme]|nr:PAS domain S-box protein [Leptospira inadai serovar Lyme]
MSAKMTSTLIKVKQVLVIEDNPADSRLIGLYLEEAGGHSLCTSYANTAAEGLEILRSRPGEIECIVLDLSLPDSFGLDGFDAIRLEFSGIPIVICSGSEDEGLASEALKAGAQDYLIKGKFDSHLLNRSILYAMERNDLLSKLNEQASIIRESEERYRLLFENNPLAVWVYDYKTLEVIDANQEVERLYGYSWKEIQRLAISDIRLASGAKKAMSEHAALKSGKNPPVTTVHRRRTGEFILVEVTSYKFKLRGREIVLAIVVDITKWKQAEESLRESLRDKEVLLQEIHHRVKNNLQIMASLLNLQSNYAKNKEVIRELKDTESRIYSMSLVHNELYNSKNLADVKLRSYIDKLLDNLWNVYGVGEEIERRIEVGELSLEVDTAIPLGMILNEIATNSLKYAFQNRTFGKFFISAVQDEKTIRMEIGDDGGGIPNLDEIEKKETLGLQLVRILSKQLKGDLSVTTDSKGTRFVIIFPTN